MKDLVIVGAGPVGLYAGILASLHNLNTVVIEGKESVGGQLSFLYPEKNIVEDMAAVADIISAECMMKSGFGEPHKTEKC
jgi:thioredoxin reductase